MFADKLRLARVSRLAVPGISRAVYRHVELYSTGSLSQVRDLHFWPQLWRVLLRHQDLALCPDSTFRPLICPEFTVT